MNKSFFLLTIIFNLHLNAIDLSGKISCVHKNEPTIETVKGVQCSKQFKFKLPDQAQSMIDFSNVAEGNKGTCSDFISRIPYDVLTDEINTIDLIQLHKENKLPVLIKLPIVENQYPSCHQLCDLAQFGYPKTQFGFTLKFQRHGHKFGKYFPEGFKPVIRVEAPWFLVTGNEGGATACMDGRPSILEYGAPLAAKIYNFDIFGFSTSLTTEKIGYALIDLIPENLIESDECSPYKCEFN